MSTIAERLKILREKKDLKQKEVASLTGLVRATLANWETGRTEPDLGSVRLLAEFYDVTTDYLLGRTDDPTPPPGHEGKSAGPDFDLAFQEKNLGDAIVRIVNICAEFGLPKDIMFKMIEKAVEKFGPPGGNGGGAGSVGEDGGIAAHGPGYPGSGIFDDNDNDKEE